MLKTDYLGWSLVNMHKDDDVWYASYTKEKNYTTGFGKNPEAAVASAQKMVQRKEK